MTFGEKIKYARKTKKLTQKELAEQVGAKHNSISDWENDKNKPDPDTIELLCGVLDITPNYLLGTKNDTEYGKIVGEIMSDTETLDMIEEYKTLSAENQKAIRQIISSLKKAGIKFPCFSNMYLL